MDGVDPTTLRLWSVLGFLLLTGLPALFLLPALAAVVDVRDRPEHLRLWRTGWNVLVLPTAGLTLIALAIQASVVAGPAASILWLLLDAALWGLVLGPLLGVAAFLLALVRVERGPSDGPYPPRWHGLVAVALALAALLLTLYGTPALNWRWVIGLPLYLLCAPVLGFVLVGSRMASPRAVRARQEAAGWLLGAVLGAAPVSLLIALRPNWLATDSRNETATLLLLLTGLLLTAIWVREPRLAVRRPLVVLATLAGMGLVAIGSVARFRAQTRELPAPRKTTYETSALLYPPYDLFRCARVGPEQTRVGPDCSGEVPLRALSGDVPVTLLEDGDELLVRGRYLDWVLPVEVAERRRVHFNVLEPGHIGEHTVDEAIARLWNRDFKLIDPEADPEYVGRRGPVDIFRSRHLSVQHFVDFCSHVDAPCRLVIEAPSDATE